MAEKRARRKYSPKEKMQIVLEGMRGDQAVADACRMPTRTILSFSSAVHLFRWPGFIGVPVPERDEEPWQSQ